MNLERLYKNFAIMTDWQDRYRFIIKLGNELPKFDESKMTEENRVHGCMSRVFMTLNWIDDDPKKLDFQAISDASIVNGLIAVLKIVYDGKTKEELKEISIDEVFQKLELEGHLSPTRRNGFFSMVERIQREIQ